MKKATVALALSLPIGVANAQIQWLNPVSGNWTTAANWAGGNAPDSNGEIAEISVPGTYTVTYSAFSVTVGGLLLTNPSATVNINHSTNDTRLTIGGTTWTNDGLVTLTPGSLSDSELRLDSAALTMNGSGALRMIAGTFRNEITTSNPDNILTNAATHRIVGDGFIEVALVNDGLVRAENAADVLRLDNNPKTNNGVFEAVGGGKLELYTFLDVTQGPAGIIRADGAGSLVTATSVDLVGGSVQATNGGLVQWLGSGELTDVTLSGPQEVVAGAHMRMAGGGVTNNADITIQPSTSVSGTTLDADATITIGGTGTIQLNADAGNPSSAGMLVLLAINTMTFGPGQTISGTGRIRGTLANNGLIDANVAGEILELESNITNNSVLRATSGGTLLLDIGDIQNNGQIRATGAGSLVQCTSSRIQGGSLIGLGGGAWAISGVSEYSDLTASGTHELAAGSTLEIGGSGITNNAAITINASASATTSTLRSTVPLAIIGGTGTIQLNGNAGDIDSARLTALNPGNAFVLGSNQMLTGTGAIFTDCGIFGTIAPGVVAGTIGRLELRSGNLSLVAATDVQIDVYGTAAGAFDTIAASAGTAIALDGKLNVAIGGGYVPAQGDEFAIVTHDARNGAFDQIVASDPGPGNAWRVRYEATQVMLTVTCDADLDGDHAVSLNDLTGLLSNFGMAVGAQGEDGDIDGDGDVDLSDLTAQLANFGTTCP